MKLIVHTKYGKFEGVETPYDKTKYLEVSGFLSQIHKLDYVSFDIANGEIFLTKSMIDDCIVELIK
jgi:hypothetical protein